MNPTPIAAPGVSVEIEAIRDLLDVIHAGRFVPLTNSEGLCKSVLDNAESALTALLASAAGGEVAQYQVKATYGNLWANVERPEYDAILKSEGPEMVRKLYAQPPTPVGAPQGVTDAEISRALNYMGIPDFKKPHAQMRDTLEDFAENRLAATPAGAVPVEPTGLPVLQLAQRITELCDQHGSLRAAARVLDVDPGYLSRIGSGESKNPGETLLRRMGLREITTYERTK